MAWNDDINNLNNDAANLGTDDSVTWASRVAVAYRTLIVALKGMTTAVLGATQQSQQALNAANNAANRNLTNLNTKPTTVQGFLGVATNPSSSDVGKALVLADHNQRTHRYGNTGIQLSDVRFTGTYARQISSQTRTVTLSVYNSTSATSPQVDFPPGSDSASSSLPEFAIVGRSERVSAGGTYIRKYTTTETYLTGPLPPREATRTVYKIQTITYDIYRIRYRICRLHNVYLYLIKALCALCV